MRGPRQQPWWWTLGALLLLATGAHSANAAGDADEILSRLATDKGIVLLDGSADLAIDLAKQSKLLVYLQLPSEEAAHAARQAADAAGLLGSRIHVEHGPWSSLHLANNLADAAIVTTAQGQKAAQQHRQELLRVVQPLGKLLIGEETITKPYPKDADDWSHPYHGPDNNPQSRDRIARYPYLTQFLAEPWYCPMPEVTVVSGGRVFKAFGHIAFKKREWRWLNKLVAINAYNGTMLWERSLTPGFIIHRNTIVATPETLCLADNDSCKVIDAATGKVKEEIVAPDGGDGKSWKWMSIQNGVLYGMVGEKEKPVPVQKGVRARGGWPWGPWPGFDINNYKTGFGRTMFAMDLKTQKVVWTHREKTEPFDARALCMSGGKIYYYCHPKFLACVDAKTGEQQWRNSSTGLLEAIGPHDKAQNPRQGFFTSVYMKCNDKALYFAGPQRKRLVAASTEDGRLLWDYKAGNFQLVIRDDGLYAMGRMETSKKFDLLTGKMVGDLTCFRRACTRATGSIDTIFTRGHPGGGTLQFKVEGSRPRRIALMRPACHDGVVVAGGQLYWGPWMCDCNLQLVGFICLGPAGDFDFEAEAKESERLVTVRDAGKSVTKLLIRPGDWPAYRGDNQRSGASGVDIPTKAALAWTHEPTSKSKPTAPITAAGTVFVSGADGAVRALDAKSGELRWKAYTAGPVRYPPAVEADGRLFVGSGDGWIHAYEADSGKSLWRFRAAPAERKINVHGRLYSNWPVGSGVLVDQGVVYAGAGITSYDGTHVYALDAKTGRIRWQNNTSGHLADDDRTSGVSVQGHLLLHQDRVYMAGGNVVSPAIYDTKDGKCLNTLDDEWGMARRGRELFLVDGKVEVFDKLLYGEQDYLKRPNHVEHFVQTQRDDVLIRGIGGRLVRVATPSKRGAKLRATWQSTDYEHIAALALGNNAVVVAGELPSSDDASPQYAVSALDIKDGRKLWTQALAAMPTSWGLALNAEGRVVVSLENGQVACIAPAD